MNNLKTKLWLVFLFSLVLAYCIVGPLFDDKPAKREVEVTIATTNVNATVITWTKTSNSNQVVWGFVEIDGRLLPILPTTK